VQCEDKNAKCLSERELNVIESVMFMLNQKLEGLQEKENVTGNTENLTKITKFVLSTCYLCNFMCIHIPYRFFVKSCKCMYNFVNAHAQANLNFFILRDYVSTCLIPITQVHPLLSV